MKLLNELFHRLFPRAAEMNAVMAHVEDLEEERGKLKHELKTLWDSYYAHDATVKSQRAEIASLKAKLREQVDADLLLVSARIAMTILKGQKPAATDVALQQSLMQQQMAYAQQSQSASMNPYYDGGSLLNALGLRGILG